MARTKQRQPRGDGNLSTIEDVARLAGVSTATVSRFVNNPDVVAAKSREKVQAAIAELKYVPNALAGSLASNNSQQVAILIPRLASSIIEQPFELLVERLTAERMVPFLAATGIDPVRINDVLMGVLSRRVTAVLTTLPIPEPAGTLLKNSGTTVIEMWGLPAQPFDIAIGFSHFAVGQAIARYVHKKRYKRPLFASSQGPAAQRRRQGFEEMWEQLGGTSPVFEEVPFPSNYGHAEAVLAAIEELDQRPDIVIAASDFLAQGLIAGAPAHGLRVPDDLAVIGFGDLSISAMVKPAITTIRIDGVKIAEKALEVIRLRAQKEELEGNRFDCGFELIERESA